MRQNQLVVHPDGRGNGRGNNGTPNYKNGSAAHGRGHAYNIDAEEAREQPATVMVPFSLILYPLLFYLIREHPIHSCPEHLHFVMAYHTKRCIHP